MNQVLGIHHISAFTKSAEENHFFYTEVLGLRFVKNTVNQENTAMRHLFYGDYKGSPGTLLTFFELPRSGRSYLENNYFSTVSLSIPTGSLPYWKERLEEHEVHSIQIDTERRTLSFEDPDDLSLRLIESTKEILPNHATKHSAVPLSKQIVAIESIDIAVENIKKESDFLVDWLQLRETETAGKFTDNQESFTIQLEQTSSKDETRFGRGAVDHVALSYENFDALIEKKKQAEQLGFTVEKIVNRGYFSSLYVEDPFGQRFELATLKPGFTLDESLEELGNNLALPDFLEPERKEIENKLEEK